MQCRPLPANAFHVKRSPVDLKPICPIWRSLGRRSDAQAGPHSYGGLLMIQFGDKRHRAVALEILPPQSAAQVVGCMFLFLALLHTLLWIQTTSRLRETEAVRFLVPAILLQSA